MIFMVIFEKEPKYVILFYIYGIKIAVKKIYYFYQTEKKYNFKQTFFHIL